MVNIKKLDLNLLVVFDTLLQEKNVTRAGEKLGMAQPSVSHALNRLRVAIGDPLFIRTPHGMEPTSLALRLAQPVQIGLNTLREGLEQSFDFVAFSSQRRFRLLMSDAAQIVVLPTLIKHLKTVAPEVKITTLALPRENYANALENDQADLAVGNLHLLNDTFYQQRLFNDNYVCLLRKGHPLSNHKGKLGLHSYLQAEHLTVINSVGDAMIFHELNRQGLTRNVTLEVPSFLAVAEIVKGSNLIATAPSLLVTAQSLKLTNDIHELPFTLPKANVRQFWHQHHHNDSANRWIRKQLIKLHQTPSMSPNVIL